MWAHYAGAFQGMCISYNLKKLLQELEDDDVFVRMAYNEKAPMLVRDRQTAEQRARMVLSTKTVRWSQEREWRLIRPIRGRRLPEARTVFPAFIWAPACLRSTKRQCARRRSSSKFLSGRCRSTSMP